jgi:hypothetical protein
MTDPLTNRAAEAEVLKAKTPAAVPGLAPAAPLGVTAAQAANAAPVRTINPANIAAAIASVAAAQQSINTAGDVTGDLALATTGCTTALKWLNVPAAKAAAATPKA